MMRELCAMPVSAGLVVYALFMGAASADQNLVALMCMASVFLFCAAAIRWRLEVVPVWLRMADNKLKG